MNTDEERALPAWVRPLLGQGWRVAFVRTSGAAFSFRLTDGRINLTHHDDPSGWYDIVGPVKGRWGSADACKVAKELGLATESDTDALLICARHSDEVARWMTSFRRQWMLCREAIADFRTSQRMKKRAGVL